MFVRTRQKELDEAKPIKAINYCSEELGLGQRWINLVRRTVLITALSRACVTALCDLV